MKMKMGVAVIAPRRIFLDRAIAVLGLQWQEIFIRSGITPF